MTWWPFRFGTKEGRLRQKAQVEQSVERISQDGRRKVDEAAAEMSQAAESMKTAITSRVEESSHLRDTLLSLIDRQTSGRFNLRKHQGPH